MDIIELQRAFAESLTELMAERNIESIADLSKQLNIPRPTISRWINMTRSPQIDSLVAIAQFFGVSVDYLLGIEK